MQVAGSWKGGGEISICPRFLSALTQARGFNYHLYADGSQMCISSSALCPKLHIFYYDLITSMKMLVDISNSTCPDVITMSSSPNLLIPSLLLSTRGSGHLSFLSVFYITMSYPLSSSFGSTNLTTSPPLLLPSCS